ncbi:MAG: Gfo/Idh/MocA family oxidoreductase [Clostridia bacterium]|nr:Gfo/Idh/MocA family oxidoreductase [Clostridia bacterium]
MRKVKWGVLGTADIAWGQTIPGMLRTEHCELYAVAGRKTEKAERYRDAFGFRKAYTGYEALLEDAEVEAVYIPLPNDLHYEWTIKALKAKKHVLCEKPLAANEKQAEEMFRAAEENGVNLMEAFAYLHSPFVSAVREEIDSGAVGEIRYLESAFITPRRPDTDIRLRKETCGGALYDLGCYCVSMALWMLGREPDEVRASAQFSDKKVDLFTSVLLLYKNGAVADLDCGMLLPEGRLDRFRIHGTRGTIVSPVEFNQCGKIPYTVIRDGAAVTKEVDAPNNYALEAEQMSLCVLRGDRPHVSKEFSLRVARVTDRILREIGY